MLKYLSFEVRSGVSMLTLDEHIRRLKLDQSIDESSILTMYYNFYQFLHSGSEDCIIRFLYLLSYKCNIELYQLSSEVHMTKILSGCNTGLHLVANALFSSNKRVVEYARLCLNKIESSAIGKKYIAQLNFVVLTKYINSNN